jgi:predicted adenine nucleotide alpha hydrolase (AANH) superfamily ATPase
MKRIILHFCCAPCGVYPNRFLKGKGYDITGIFFNPNIHPYQEYKKRLTTLKEYAHKEELPLIVVDEYDLEKYIQRVAYRETIRCKLCYIYRLDRVASIAKKGNYDGFSTTLLVSPRQKHNLIIGAGKAAEEKYNTPFVYYDFRDGWKISVECSKEQGMYRQDYCGCIFSEYERYKDSKT